MEVEDEAFEGLGVRLVFYDTFVKRRRVQCYQRIGAGPFSTTKSYWGLVSGFEGPTVHPWYSGQVLWPFQKFFPFS